MLDFSGRWLGLMVVFMGISAILLAGVRRKNESGDAESWRDKYGKLLKTTGALVALLGTLQLCGLIFRPPTSLGPVPPPGSLYPPGMVVHQHNAGTPDSEGWCKGESTEGNFSVEVPGVYDDYTLVTDTTPGNKVTIYGVGATVDNLGSFTVQEEKRPANLPYLTLEQFEEQEKPFLNGKPKKFMVDGFEGIELEIANAPNGKYMRYLRLRNSTITMTLEFPPEKSTQAAELARRFLDSLKLQKSAK